MQKNVLHHTKIVTAEDIKNKKFWEKSNFREKEKFENLINYLKREKNIIVKETNAILQIKLLKKLLPNFHFIHLLRNPAAILDSHIRIPNVIEDWHYLERINLFRKNSSKYSYIYDMAEKEILYGSKRWSVLFAHIVVQTLMLQDEIKDTISYEELVKYDLNNLLQT